MAEINIPELQKGFIKLAGSIVDRILNGDGLIETFDPGDGYEDVPIAGDGEWHAVFEEGWY